MTIAIFTDSYPPFINGVSVSAFNLVKVLREHGHRVFVVTPRFTDGKMEIIGDDIYIPGIKAKKFYGYRFTKLFDEKVMKILKDNHVEVIHQETELMCGWFGALVAKRLHLPLVYTYHTSYEDYTYYVSKGNIVIDATAKKLLRTATKFYTNRVTQFITPSRKTADFIRTGNHVDNYINIIPTGIDFSKFSNTSFPKEKYDQFRKQYGIKNNTKVLLLVGRLAKEKSMDFSIKGFAKFLNEYTGFDAKMFIVGEGPGRNELEDLVAELNLKDKVFFVGAVNKDEVPFYYSICDVYTSASITETQGLTFMEAMAAKRIVLARYDKNLEKTIIHKVNGFFFRDEEQFINYLHYVLTASKEQLEPIMNEAQKTLDNYSMENFYERSIEVYRRAARKFW